MKVAIVAPFFTPFIKGSDYLLASYLAQAGHEIHFIASTAKAPREYVESNYNLQLPFQVRYARTIATLIENPLVLSIDQYLDIDPRISTYGAIQHSKPYRGRCLPKDIKALIEFS